MKRKYLFIIIIGLLFLTGCGKKNALKCTFESKGINLGVSAETEVNIEFDKDDKYLGDNRKVVMKFNSEEEAKIIKQNGEVFCEGNIAKECTVVREDKDIIITLTEVKDDAIKGFDKEQVKEHFKKLNKDAICK